MIRRRRALPAILALGAAALCATGVAPAAPGSAPRVDARAWLLMDHDSGQVLGEQAADQALAPASLAKLMSAYLLFEKLARGELATDARVPVSARAAAMNGSRLQLAAGSDVAFEDLLKGMLVRSANDATLALAEHAAGDEASFVAAMNAKAAALELHATHFANATGLDHPAQRTSARDIAHLASRLIRDFPDHYQRYLGLREFTFRHARHYNRNLLLWRDDSIDGVKTGRTHAAGHCLIASAQRDDMRLIAAVLGAPDDPARFHAAERLLAYGFERFETRLVLRREEPATAARVWLGAADSVSLGLTHSLYATLPRGAFDRLRTRFTLPEEVYAPVGLGQELGRVALDFEGKTLAERPLVALTDLAPGNLVQRAFDQLQLWLH